MNKRTITAAAVVAGLGLSLGFGGMAALADEAPPESPVVAELVAPAPVVPEVVVEEVTSAVAVASKPKPPEPEKLPICHSGSGKTWVWIAPDASGYNGHKHHDADIVGLTEAECLAKNMPEFVPYATSARWLLPATWDRHTTPTYQAAIFPQDRLAADAVVPCDRWSQDDGYWIENAADELVWVSLGDVLTQGEDSAIYASHVFTYGGDCPPQVEPVSPVVPLVKDKPCTADDHYGLPDDSDGITYIRDGLAIVAVLTGDRPFAAVLPDGWVNNGNGTATYAFNPALFTAVDCPVEEPEDVVVTPLPPTFECGGVVNVPTDGEGYSYGEPTLSEDGTFVSVAVHAAEGYVLTLDGETTSDSYVWDHEIEACEEVPPTEEPTPPTETPAAPAHPTTLPNLGADSAASYGLVGGALVAMLGGLALVVGFAIRRRFEDRVQGAIRSVEHHTTEQ